MTREFVFDVWAPAQTRWSRWAKPVLFACMDPPFDPRLNDPVTWDSSWVPAPDENVALVLDLPGREGVDAALALAERGYRPVPLYNALPLPLRLTDGASPLFAEAVVDARAVMVAIYQGTERLSQINLSAEAPPAFLLDWNRRGAAMQTPPPGSFDNRSVSFTTDFPSANFLLAHDVRRVVVVQPTGGTLQADLVHTLRRWQEAGVALEVKPLDMSGPPSRCLVPKPRWFGWIWQRVLLAFGLQRSTRGGFGGWVPNPSSG